MDEFKVGDRVTDGVHRGTVKALMEIDGRDGVLVRWDYHWCAPVTLSPLEPEEER